MPLASTLKTTKKLRKFRCHLVLINLCITHSPTPLPTHSLTHSLTDALTHSPTHPLGWDGDWDHWDSDIGYWDTIVGSIVDYFCRCYTEFDFTIIIARYWCRPVFTWFDRTEIAIAEDWYCGLFSWFRKLGAWVFNVITSYLYYNCMSQYRPFLIKWFSDSLSLLPKWKPTCNTPIFPFGYARNLFI